MSQGEEKKVGWINDLLNALPFGCPGAETDGRGPVLVRFNHDCALKSIDWNWLRASVDSRQPRRKWDPRAWTGPDLCSSFFLCVCVCKATLCQVKPSVTDYLKETLYVDFDGSLKQGNVIFSSYIGGQWIMKIYPHPILRGPHTQCSHWMLKATGLGQIILVQLIVVVCHPTVQTWKPPPTVLTLVSANRCYHVGGFRHTLKL